MDRESELVKNLEKCFEDVSLEDKIDLINRINMVDESLLDYALRPMNELPGLFDKEDIASTLSMLRDFNGNAEYFLQDDSYGTIESYTADQATRYLEANSFDIIMETWATLEVPGIDDVVKDIKSQILREAVTELMEYEQNKEC